MFLIGSWYKFSSGNFLFYMSWQLYQCIDKIKKGETDQIIFGYWLLISDRELNFLFLRKLLPLKKNKPKTAKCELRKKRSEKLMELILITDLQSQIVFLSLFWFFFSFFFVIKFLICRKNIKEKENISKQKKRYLINFGYWLLIFDLIFLSKAFLSKTILPNYAELGSIC